MKKMETPVLLPVHLDLFDGTSAAGDGGTAAGGQPDGQAGGGTADTGQIPVSGKKAVYGKQAAAGPAPDGRQTAQAEQNPQYQSASDTLEERQRRYRELVSGEFRDLYDEDAKRLVSRSAREAAALREQADRTQPILEMLLDRYKIRDGDMGKLRAAVENDSAYWSQAAEEAGMSVEQYKRFQQLQRQNQELLRAQRQRMGQERADAQLRAWNGQAEQLRAIYPSFDLTREAQNREFLSMLKAGVPVRQAYEVVHMDEIKAAAAAETAQAGAETARAGAETAKTAAETARGRAEIAGSAAVTARSAAEYSANAAADSARTATQYALNPPVIQKGTWWTWNAQFGHYSDTGIIAIGQTGAAGKSAYQCAVDGGYTGTEAQFMVLLASGPWLPVTGGDLVNHGLLQAYITFGPQGLRYDPFTNTLTCCTKDSITAASPDYAPFGCDTPTLDFHAATKRYVDRTAEIKQDKLSGTAGRVVGFNDQGLAVAIPGIKMTYDAQTNTLTLGEAE